jgi:hypothetical protein
MTLVCENGTKGYNFVCNILSAFQFFTGTSRGVNHFFWQNSSKERDEVG